MMRAIKFRAWDAVHEHWVEGLTYTLHTSGNLINIPDGIILMQFTGLLDKNGKDIYEGDIVQYDAIDRQGIVTWSETYPGFIILNPKKTGVSALHDEWEVIGNIYEHPELVRQS